MRGSYIDLDALTKKTIQIMPVVETIKSMMFNIKKQQIVKV